MVLHIDPVAKERPRFNKLGHAYTPEKTRYYEKSLAQLMRFECRLRSHLPYLGPLKLAVRFILKKPSKPKHKTQPISRPDVDNFLKGLLDAANGILWGDDSQIVHVDAKKIYDIDNKIGRIELILEEFIE